MVQLGVGGHHHHRQAVVVDVGADLAEEGDAVHFRHVPVDQRDVGLLHAVQLVQRLAAVDGRRDLKSEFLQIGRQNLANDVRIVDYERVHANLRQMAAVAASGSPLRANLNTATIL